MIKIRMKNSEEAETFIEELHSKDISKIMVVSNNNSLVEIEAMPKYSSECLSLVGNALATHIKDYYEQSLIHKIIEQSYGYFDKKERAIIFDKAKDKVAPNYILTASKMLVASKLKEYLSETEDELVLSGFINFRLKDYFKMLEDEIDKAVDDFLMDKEYKEFVKLLKYFVEIQDSKCEVIYIEDTADGRYKMLDQNNIEVTDVYMKDFISDINSGEINFDDLLVSTLITLAPKKIVLRANIKNNELVETLRAVFGEAFIEEVRR